MVVVKALTSDHATIKAKEREREREHRIFSMCIIVRTYVICNDGVILNLFL